MIGASIERNDASAIVKPYTDFIRNMIYRMCQIADASTVSIVGKIISGDMVSQSPATSGANTTATSMIVCLGR